MYSVLRFALTARDAGACAYDADCCTPAAQSCSIGQTYDKLHIPCNSEIGFSSVSAESERTGHVDAEIYSVRLTRSTPRDNLRVSVSTSVFRQTMPNPELPRFRRRQVSGILVIKLGNRPRQIWGLVTGKCTTAISQIVFIIAIE